MYLGDDDVQPPLSENVVLRAAQPFLEALASDHVHVVTFSTTCDLDFQQYEDNHCMPVNYYKVNEINSKKKLKLRDYTSKDVAAYVDHSIR